MACSNGINNGLQKMGLCDLDVNYTSDYTLRICSPFPRLRSPFVTMVTTRTWLCHVFNKSQLSACGVSCGRQVVRFFYSAWELLFVVHWMLVYRAVFESESAPGCILVLLLVTLSVVCSRAVLCAGCRLAGCIVRGLRELSRQNIARWWI